MFDFCNRIIICDADLTDHYGAEISVPYHDGHGRVH